MIIREESPVNRTRYPMSPTSMDMTEKYKATPPKDTMAGSDRKPGSSSTDEHRSRKRKAPELDTAESLSAVRPGQSRTAEEPRPSKRPRHSSPTVLNDINNVSDPRLDGEAKARVHPRHSWPVAMHPHDRPQYDIVTSARIVNVQYSEHPHPKPSVSAPTAARAHESSGVFALAAIVEGKSHEQLQRLSSPPVVPAPDKVGAVSFRDDVAPLASTVKLSPRFPLHSLESAQAHEERDQHTPVIEVESSGNVHRSLPQVSSPATIDKCLRDEVAQPSAAVKVKTSEEVHGSPIPTPAEGTIAVSSIEAREQPDHLALVPERVASQVEEKEPTTPAVIVSGPPEQSHRSLTSASVPEVAKGARFDWYALLAAPEEPKRRKRARARSPRIPADVSWRTLWHLASDLRPTKRARHRSPSQPIQIVAAAPQDASKSTEDKTPDLPCVSPLPVLVEEETIASEDEITSRQQAVTHGSVKNLSAIEIEAEYDEELIDFKVEPEADGIDGHAEIAYEHGTRKMPINQIEGDFDYYEEDEESASPSGQVGQAAVFFDRGRTPSPMERSGPPSMSPGRFRAMSLLRTPSPPRASSSTRTRQLPKNHRDYRPPSLPATPPPLDLVSPTTSLQHSWEPRPETSHVRSRSRSSSPVHFFQRERSMASGPLSRLRRSERLRNRSQSLLMVPLHARRNVILPQTPPPLLSQTPSDVAICIAGSPSAPSRSLPQSRPLPTTSALDPGLRSRKLPSIHLPSCEAHSPTPKRLMSPAAESGYASTPPPPRRVFRTELGELRAEEILENEWSSEDEIAVVLFPHNLPIKYEFPVIEPLSPDDRDWLAMMHEQLKWADDYGNRFLVESRETVELATPPAFVGKVLLDVAETRFWGMAKRIRIHAGTIFGCYLFVKIMKHDAIRFCDVEEEFEDDLLSLLYWDLYIRQWDEFNQCFRPYHHMPIELLYPKKSQANVEELLDEEGHVLIPALREFYEDQEKKLRGGVAKAREFIQAEREADARAEQEARIEFIRQRRRAAFLRERKRWNSLSTFVPTGTYSTWPLPNWGKCAHWKDRRHKKAREASTDKQNAASEDEQHCQAVFDESAARSTSDGPLLDHLPPTPTSSGGNAALHLPQSHCDGFPRQLSRSPPRSRSRLPLASRQLSLSPPRSRAALSIASRRFSLSPPRSRITLQTVSRPRSLSPPRSRVPLSAPNQERSLSPPRSRVTLPATAQQLSRSPPRTRRRPSGTICSINGPLEDSDFSEDEDEDDDTDDDTEEDDQPEANLADPLLLSPPTDDDPRVLWAEIVLGIVRWSRRFPNYPRKCPGKTDVPSNEKADMPLNVQANTPATTHPDKEHVLCLDASASTTLQQREGGTPPKTSIAADDSSSLTPSLDRALQSLSAFAGEEGIMSFALRFPGPHEAISILGKRKRGSGDAFDLVTIRKVVQPRLYKRRRINALLTEILGSTPLLSPVETNDTCTHKALLPVSSPTPLGSEDQPPASYHAGSVTAVDAALDSQNACSNQGHATVLDTQHVGTPLPSLSETQCSESTSANQPAQEQGHLSLLQDRSVDSVVDDTTEKFAPLALGTEIVITGPSGKSKRLKVDRYLGVQLVRVVPPPVSSVEQHVELPAESSNRVRFADAPVPSKRHKASSINAQLDSPDANKEPLEVSALKRKRSDNPTDSNADGGHRPSIRIPLSKRQRTDSSAHVVVPSSPNGRSRPIVSKRRQLIAKPNDTLVAARGFSKPFFAVQSPPTRSISKRLRQESVSEPVDVIAAQSRVLARLPRRKAKLPTLAAGQWISQPLNPIVNAERDQSRRSTKRKRRDLDAESRSVTKPAHVLGPSTSKRQRVDFVDSHIEPSRLPG
ncbi:uncharacterized protein LAESUDRAFT_380523 [Laetiporus sulphureus 93-53]|uniref:Uncharacterized protein n=1 Tax=Laetiporus sulphureus 93-53 TaxID=1314785 RepID=A0A165CLH4_9APHY|nr:uncharacterized protein LAESUDRAFT_380523 [Laetiporus sulphureus 93-53]KZT03022.1 hypothetical protein LAESUDRAFT_380523 [Laetiporus sulphureus 93-53]